MKNQKTEQSEIIQSKGKKMRVAAIFISVFAIAVVLYFTMSSDGNSRPSTPAEIAAQEEFQVKLLAAQKECELKMQAAAKEASPETAAENNEVDADQPQ